MLDIACLLYTSFINESGDLINQEIPNDEDRQEQLEAVSAGAYMDYVGK